MRTLQYLLLVCLGFVATQADNRVSRIGNPIRSSLSGVDVPGATFLINDIVLADGVLFAFRAYFRSDMPLRFQIWRPATNALTAGEFELISDTLVIPSLINEVEDIYMAAKLIPCVVVQQGDRLGLSFSESPGAVSYTFDASDPTVFGKTIDPNSLLNPGSVIKFDTLIFPYDFSVAAYVDIRVDNYNIAAGDYTVECPTDLLIPDVDIVDAITPTPSVTGAPGATGATGPQGPRGETGPEGPAGEDGIDGMTGATGPQGTMGVAGPEGPMGATGPDGINGLDGATGPQGPRGERGPAGPPGPATGGNTNALPASNNDDFTSNGLWSYIVLAWLLLLTIIVVVVVIVYVVTSRRRQNKDNQDKANGDPTIPDVEWNARRSSHSSWLNPQLVWNATKGGHDETPAPPTSAPSSPNPHAVPSAHDDPESWMGTMKSTTETSYSNDTLKVREGKQTDSNCSTSTNSFDSKSPLPV